MVLRAKSERDCRFCQEDKRERKSAERELPVIWALRKGKGGPKKKIATSGYFCRNQECEYYGITEEEIHALVGYGTHGAHEVIRDLKCQACGEDISRPTEHHPVPAKKSLRTDERILWLLVLGVDTSVLEEVFGVWEITIRTWLCRSGMQSKKLHERFLAELELAHVQLDEL